MHSGLGVAGQRRLELCKGPRQLHGAQPRRPKRCSCRCRSQAAAPPSERTTASLALPADMPGFARIMASTMASKVI